METESNFENHKGNPSNYSRRLIFENHDTSFYKDEGGKDRGIVLVIKFTDSNGDLIEGNNVPLKFLLTHGGGKIFHNQEALVFDPTSERLINTDGTARLKIRIQELSQKNRYKFEIKAEVDSSKTNEYHDVQPALSFQINVKSKSYATCKKRKTASVSADEETSDANHSSEKSLLPGLETQILVDDSERDEEIKKILESLENIMRSDDLKFIAIKAIAKSYEPQPITFSELDDISELGANFDLSV